MEIYITTNLRFEGMSLSANNQTNNQTVDQIIWSAVDSYRVLIRSNHFQEFKRIVKNPMEASSWNEFGELTRLPSIAAI